MKVNGRDTEDIKQMVMRVLNEKDQWSKHVAHTCCKCEKCTCGKHKCKLSPPKFQLKTGNTTYNNDFRNHKNLGNSLQKLKNPIQTYHPKQFINKSQYRQEYYRKKAKHEYIKGEKKPDNLCCGGPNFARTSYQDSYTPKKGQKAQMIKNGEHLNNTGMKMNGCSHYRDTFHGKKSKVDAPIKHRDNLKTQHIPFTGTSSYDHDFSGMKPYKKNPQMDNFAPNREYHSTHGIRPKSSYRCDYGQKKIIRCPAEFCC